jgi:hypothetical protein
MCPCWAINRACLNGTAGAMEFSAQQMSSAYCSILFLLSESEWSFEEFAVSVQRISDY